MKVCNDFIITEFVYIISYITNKLICNLSRELSKLSEFSSLIFFYY